MDNDSIREALRPLAALLAPLVAEELAKRSAPAAYSTACQAEWPRLARSRRHARELIRRVPGHERVGTGRATEWRVSVDAFERFYTKTATAAASFPLSLVSDEAVIAAALAHTRATRRAS